MMTYDTYKDSRIVWLGDIPGHWRIVRYKDFSSIVRGGSPRPAGDPKYYGGSIPFLKVGDLTKNETPYLDTFKHTITELGLNNTRLVKPQTLLLTNSGATLGIPKITKIQTTFNDGIAAFLGVRKCDLLYLYFLLKSKTKWFLNLASLGQGQPNLNTEIVGNSFLALPPLPEQKAIAQYLYTKTQAIDKKVKLLEQKIDYFKELRKSLIDDVVTKGLDKTVALKDSGIDWIGQIPEHWEVQRFKDSFDLKTGNSISDKGAFEVKENAHFYVSTKDIDIHSGTINYDNGIYVPKDDKTFKRAKSHSTLICIEGANAGKKIGFTEKEICFVNKLCSIKGKKKSIYDKYNYYFINSKGFDNQFSSIISGLIGGVSINQIKFFTVLMPPKEEQTAIAKYLDHKSETIDKIIKNILEQIVRLKELRKTQINDVVTGKIKVVA